MRLDNYIFPNVDEDPQEGCQIIDPLKYRCERCIQYGMLNSDECRLVPCTICAMANGGAWGWEEGHYGDPNFSTKINGLPPGKSGIVDVLTNHSLNPTCDWDFMDEEVVLGFAQYALYNHYKWKDIIDLLPGKSKKRTGVPPWSYMKPSDDDQSNWYWWKVIPDGVVLPKRLVSVLQKQLVKYELERINSEQFVPKTHQLLGDRELSDDIWETFWDTYVEPGHVAHLFRMTMETVLDTNLPFQPYSVGTDPGWLSQEINSFVVNEIQRTEGLHWLDKEWLEFSIGSERFCEKANYFVLIGQGDLFEGALVGYDGLYRRVLRIYDRDVFGTNLEEVIHYDYIQEEVFHRRSDITDTSDMEWRKKLWNTLGNNLSPLMYDVWSRLCISDTVWFNNENLNSNVSDYENEKEYRKQDCIKTISIQEELGISDTIEVEVDFDNQTLIGDPYDWSSHIEKLKELQIIMDSENVKEKVSEGVYLEMMNGLRDLYNMCQ
tara:strand:+ start:1542 stop:3014 length:1473 start_codon:yes stop_codon:yes gene_type:complete